MEGRIQAVEQGKWAGCSDRHWWRGASSGSDGSVRETVEDQDWDQLMSEEDTGTICGCRPGRIGSVLSIDGCPSNCGSRAGNPWKAGASEIKWVHHYRLSIAGRM